MAKKSEIAAKPEPSKEEEEEELEEEQEEEEDDESEEEEDADDDDDGDEEEALSNRESIRELLEPFGKDQLIDLLKDAAAKDPDLLSRISGTPAVVDPSQRKIFVHGLGWDATSESLTSAFSQYGEIEECRAVADRTTGRCKGYGFVLFRTLSAVRKALKEPQKKIGNRTASCQLASLGPIPSHQQPSSAPAMGLGMGLNPAAVGMLNQSMVPQVGLMGQGLHPSVGLVGGQGLNQPAGLMGQGLNYQMAGLGGQSAGLPTSLTSSGTTPPAYGGGLGLGGSESRVNSISSSVIGRYNSLESMQALGSYRSPYFSSAASRYQPSDYESSDAGLPSYMGRY